MRGCGGPPGPDDKWRRRRWVAILGQTAGSLAQGRGRGAGRDRRRREEKVREYVGRGLTKK